MIMALIFSHLSLIWAKPLYFDSSDQEVRNRFCHQRSPQQYLSRPENRLNFGNSGGLFNRGVCWWHDRLHRNIAYLAYFSPFKPMPHRQTHTTYKKNPSGRGQRITHFPAKGSIYELLNKIKAGNEVIEIPGFYNLNDFSRYFEKEISKFLEDWQISEGIFQGGWLKGLRGKSKVSPQKLKKQFDEVHKQVSKGRVVFLKLQLEGIQAHSWLVISTFKPTFHGLNLIVLDSNQYELKFVTYREGEHSLYYPGEGRFVPYIEFENEELKLIQTREEFCKKYQ